MLWIPMELVVATRVKEDERMNYPDRPYAMEYDPESKPERHKNGHHWAVVTGFSCFMVIGVVGIVSALIIQSSRRANPAPGTESPTFAPSTNAEAIFKKLLSTSVGDGVYEELVSRARSQLDHIGRSLGADSIGLHCCTTIPSRFIVLFHHRQLISGMALVQPPLSTDTANCSFQLLFRQEDDTLTFQDMPSLRWLSGESECIWAGVTCDQGNVVGIELGKYYKIWEELPWFF
jgi:hypothetical protein